MQMIITQMTAADVAMTTITTKAAKTRNDTKSLSLSL